MIGVRGKLFLGSVVLVLTVTVVSNFYLQSELEASLVERIQTELKRQARALSARASSEALLYDAEKLSQVSQEVAHAAQARVSIIGLNGTLLADSELSQADLRQAENHSTRSEFRAALRRGFGVARRRSATIDSSMLYVAVPIDQGAQHLGVARIAAPLSQIKLALAQLRSKLILANILSIVAALFLAFVVSHFVSRSIRHFADSARNIANLGQGRVPIYSKDEIGHIARTVNRIIDRTEKSIQDLAEENRQLTATLERIEHGVVTLNSKQKIIFANNRAINLLQLSRPVRGQSLPQELFTKDPSQNSHLKGITLGPEVIMAGNGAGQGKWLAEHAKLETSDAQVLLLRQI
ncbi:MAG: HAMP domain-containing protein [Myxococcales bacterium]|nr:MAG: HAMP domain-containing protein [Myxococcales bacterium]